MQVRSLHHRLMSAPAFVQASHGKRKQRSQEAGEEQGVGGQPRKAAKRGAGQAPSQTQKRAKYTSPGKVLRGPSRQVSVPCFPAAFLQAARPRRCAPLRLADILCWPSMFHGDNATCGMHAARTMPAAC